MSQHPRRSRLRSLAVSGLAGKQATPRFVSTGARPRLARRNFLSILDMDPNELKRCLELATQLKQERSLGYRAPTADMLAGRHVALLFEKPSLRTRTTFEIAVHELGGHVIEPQQAVTFGARESPEDVARNLERWVSVAVVRTFAQSGLDQFAAAAPGLHVINALTDEEHPCQALADLLTLQEHWESLRGGIVAFVGDGNNVATSLAHAAVMMGVTVHLTSPKGYEVPTHVLEDAARVARHGAEVKLFRDPGEAVRQAHAVYTDAWASMGHEAEADERRRVFAPYQVNAELMAKAQPESLFLHCLPAHRGDEVTDEVIDSDVSIVFDQAENRLHVQKALLVMIA